MLTQITLAFSFLILSALICLITFNMHKPRYFSRSTTAYTIYHAIYRWCLIHLRETNHFVKLSKECWIVCSQITCNKNLFGECYAVVNGKIEKNENNKMRRAFRDVKCRHALQSKLLVIIIIFTWLLNLNILLRVKKETNKYLRVITRVYIAFWKYIKEFRKMHSLGNL